MEFRIAIIFFIILFSQNSFSQNCSNTSTGFIPINDLATGYFRNMQGGLYPNGLNTKPVSHKDAGLILADQILPLDTAGNYNPISGRIVFLSVGMSNTSQEFSEFFNMINGQSYLNPKLTVVNGAQGGQTIDIIINPNANFWSVISQRLATSGVTAKQVQVVWFKEAQASPSDTSFPGYPIGLKNKFKSAMNVMKNKYANLKLCYNAGRIYAGYAASNLNPEPFAYYSGWSVKWMIEDQINGDTNLTFIGANAKSPWLAWGPYLWADGLIPRSDGLIWSCPADFNSDGTHPSAAGRQKVAAMLVNFFKTDETAKPWFLRNVTVNVNVAIEGFYDISLNILNMRDTIKAFLRNNFSPYNKIDSSFSLIDSSAFTGIFKFYNTANGTYYIELLHRNSIQTWSRLGGESISNGGIYNYNFTAAANQAYGNNLILKGAKYCIFSGDVNQDELIDGSDLAATDNDAYNFSSGYIPTDVSGDNLTDGSDFSIVDNNAFGNVAVISP